MAAGLLKRKKNLFVTPKKLQLEMSPGVPLLLLKLWSAIWQPSWL